MVVHIINFILLSTTTLCKFDNSHWALLAVASTEIAFEIKKPK